MAHNNCNSCSKVKFCSKCTKDTKCPRYDKCTIEQTPPNVAGKWRYYEEEVQHDSFADKSLWGSIYKTRTSTSEFELIQNGLFVQDKLVPNMTQPPTLSIWEKIRDYEGNFIRWQLNLVDTDYDNDYLNYNYVSTDCYNNAIYLEGIKLETGFTLLDPEQTPEVAFISITRI